VPISSQMDLTGGW